MPDLRWVLYDTATFVSTLTSTPTVHVLFQTAEGVDPATKHGGVTNMRGNGALPPDEKFTVLYVHVYPDAEIPEADIAQIWNQSRLRIYLGDTELLQVPLRFCASLTGYSGHFTQATAANRALIGLENWGYHVDPPVELPGGARFRVVVEQYTALSGNRPIKVALEGILTRP